MASNETPTPPDPKAEPIVPKYPPKSKHRYGLGITSAHVDRLYREAPKTMKILE